MCNDIHCKQSYPHQEDPLLQRSNSCINIPFRMDTLKCPRFISVLVSVALMELKRDVLRIINIIINFFLDAKHQKYYKLMLP